MLFGRDDWTLFRNLNTLGQKAGVPRDQLAALVLKEITDNALDAGAEVKLGAMSGDFYFVEDDGPGIDGDDEHIATLFSIRRPLTSSKLFRLPTRGALGNGLRVVAGCVLASGGELRVRTRGRWLRLAPQDNGHTSHERINKSASALGTRVEIRFGGDLIDDRDPLWMAKLAVLLYGESRYEGKTSPHWYDSDGFFELLQAAGETQLSALTDQIDHDKSWSAPEDLDPSEPAHKLDRGQADTLLKSLRGASKVPHANKLGCVGEETLGVWNGYTRKTCEFMVHPSRGNLAARVPAVIEVWARKLEKGDDPEIQVFVNRTPITAKMYAGQEKAETWINGCGLNHYFPTGRMPMRIYVCVTAPYMPVTTDGKEPNLKPIVNVMGDTISSAARKAKKATSSGRAVAKKYLIFDVMEEARDHASGGGEHRFSLRQLFYAVRPLLQNLGCDDDLNYNYFSTVVTDYEAQLGTDIPGMYRDTRGVIYHPHIGEQIALGTLNVEKYRRPEYRFNKILYIEKGGFFPLLVDAKWPEKHDCALLTSQGFASRAARDVIDILGESEEELLFFCIHDADGPGTAIYEALVEGTRARPGRRVRVVNLGLDPWEAKKLKLQSEKVERAKGRVPVAKYIYGSLQREEESDSDYALRRGTDWAEWLQNNRVELNAMTSPKFLRWLDEKMAMHDSLGKVVPPGEVLDKKFAETARQSIRNTMLEELIQQNKLDQRVDKTMEKVSPPNDLTKAVKSELEKQPVESWEKPLTRIAEKSARKVLKAK